MRTNNHLGCELTTLILCTKNNAKNLQPVGVNWSEVVWKAYLHKLTREREIDHFHFLYKILPVEKSEDIWPM